ADVRTDFQDRRNADKDDDDGDRDDVARRHFPRATNRKTLSSSDGFAWGTNVVVFRLTCPGSGFHSSTIFRIRKDSASIQTVIVRALVERPVEPYKSLAVPWSR